MLSYLHAKENLLVFSTVLMKICKIRKALYSVSARFSISDETIDICLTSFSVSIYKNDVFFMIRKNPIPYS